MLYRMATPHSWRLHLTAILMSSNSSLKLALTWPLETRWMIYMYFWLFACVIGDDLSFTFELIFELFQNFRTAVLRWSQRRYPCGSWYQLPMRMLKAFTRATLRSLSSFYKQAPVLMMLVKWVALWSMHKYWPRYQIYGKVSLWLLCSSCSFIGILHSFSIPASKHGAHSRITI